MQTTLFPIDLAGRQWLEFPAAGFAGDVSGIVFRTGQSSCGIPLGGIGTGCVDLDTDGTFGPLEGKNLGAFCAPGGLVDRILKAAARPPAA